MSDNEGIAGVVAANIRRHLDRRGLTITQLAELAGISRVGLSRVLGGHEGVTIERLSRIADVLEVPVWTLLRPGRGPA